MDSFYRILLQSNQVKKVYPHMRGHKNFCQLISLFFDSCIHVFHDKDFSIWPDPERLYYKNSLPNMHTGLQAWTSMPEYSSNDQEIQLWLLIQSIACQYAWPGLTVNATWRLAIVDGKPENFILLYILLLWSYNKIICLLLWSCWGNWLRWLWYHGVTIGCAIMHSIHR